MGGGRWLFRSRRGTKLEVSSDILTLTYLNKVNPCIGTNQKQFSTNGRFWNNKGQIFITRNGKEFLFNHKKGGLVIYEMGYLCVFLKIFGDVFPLPLPRFPGKFIFWYIQFIQTLEHTQKHNIARPNYTVDKHYSSCCYTWMRYAFINYKSITERENMILPMVLPRRLYNILYFGHC